MVAGTRGSLDKEGLTKMTEVTTKSAGIDTAKAKLDIAIHGGPAFIVSNEKTGWKQAADRLAAAGVTRIGIEATGGYERGAVRYLQQAGFSVVVMQPLQVKAFARLYLKRAKNDRIDAVLIAACTHLFDAANKMPPDPRFDALADHLTSIEQWEEDIVRLKTRLEHIHDSRMRRIVEGDIKRLIKRRDAELACLQAKLRQHDDLAHRFDLVESVPSIGARTALSLVIRMPELGQVSREQIAALAGLAPFVHQSGQRKGEAHIGGGRGRVRRAVYVASLAGAFRWNPQLQAIYQRLVGRGKSPKQALVACARKLLIYANTVVARGTPWETRQAD
jgi:transposase